MAASASFKKCTSCGTAMPESDGHEYCLLCLGEGHLSQSCAICVGFTPQTRKSRESRLKAALYVKALLPASELNNHPAPHAVGAAGAEPLTGPVVPATLTSEPLAHQKRSERAKPQETSRGKQKDKHCPQPEANVAAREASTPLQRDDMAISQPANERSDVAAQSIPMLSQQWEAFSLPELQNFLRILDKEEDEQLQNLRRRYAAYRNKLEDALGGVWKPG